MLWSMHKFANDPLRIGNGPHYGKRPAQIETSKHQIENGAHQIENDQHQIENCPHQIDNRHAPDRKRPGSVVDTKTDISIVFTV